MTTEQPDTNPTPETTPPTAPTPPGRPSMLSTRRRFLAALGAAGVTAAAGGVLWAALSGDDHDAGDGAPTTGGTDGTTAGTATDDTRAGAAPPVLDAAAGTTSKVLHFALGGAQLPESTVLFMSGQALPLRRHGAEVTAATGTSSQALLDALPANIDRSLVTHFVEGALVSNTAVTKGVLIDQVDAAGYIVPGAKYLGSFLHLPDASRLKVAQEHALRATAVRAMTTDAEVRRVVAAAAVGAATVDDVRAALAASVSADAPGSLLGSASAWARVGAAPATPEDAVASGDVLAPSFETAVSMVMQHPEMLKLDGDTAAQVKTVLVNEDIGELHALADQIDQLAAEGGQVGTFVPLTDDSGAPVTYPTDPAPDGSAPPPNTPMSMYQMDDGLSEAVSAAVGAALNVALTHPDLEGVTWRAPEPASPTADGVPGTTAALLGDSEVHYKLDGGMNDHRVDGLRAEKYEYDTANRKITLAVGNDWYRHVGIGVEFYDAEGNGVKLDGVDYGAPAIYAGMNATPYLGMLGMLPSAPAILGLVPAVGTNWVDVSFIFPEKAASARLFLMGLGSCTGASAELKYFKDDQGAPFRPEPDSIGMHDAGFANLCTFVLDLCLPAVMLMSAAYVAANRTDLDELRKEMADEWKDLFSELQGFITQSRKIGAAVVAGTTAAGLLAATDTHQSGFDLVKGLVLTVMAKPAGLIAGLIWRYLRNKAGSEVAMKAAPFLGEVLSIFGVMAGLVQLAATVTELSYASPVNSMSIQPTYDATIHVLPDDGSHGTAGDKVLPRTATTYELHYLIDDRAGTERWTGKVEQKDELGLVIPVAQVPVGATIKWCVTLRSAEGWVVGTGVSAALDNSHWNVLPTDVSFSIIEALYPLDSSSTYTRQWTTTGAADRVTADETRTTIGGTPADLVADDGSKLHELDGVTVGTLLGVAGYVWRAGGKWYARNLATQADASAAWNEAGPFDRRPHLAYDSLTAKDGGRAYILDPDPTNADGYYVRAADVQAGSSLFVDRSLSLAFFPTNLDAVSFNPKGQIVGVDTQNGRLWMGALADPGVDGMAPYARTTCGSGDREGLLRAPVAVACRYTGQVVVLDIDKAGSPWLRAFGLDGRPVGMFPNSTTNVSIARGTEVRTYTSLAIDGGHFHYVLSYAKVDDPASCRLDVYDPDGAFLFETSGVNAGRLAVDYWRNVFTLNYEILPGLPATGAPYQVFPVPEPSLSGWIPHTPA